MMIMGMVIATEITMVVGAMAIPIVTMEVKGIGAWEGGKNHDNFP